MSNYFEILKKRLSECEEELNRAQALLLLDPLTGFFNEQGFKRALSAEMSRCLREDHFVAISLIEIQSLDVLQNVYGVYGVQKVVAFVAQELKRILRKYDILGTTNKGLFWAVCSVKRSSEGAKISERLYKKLNQLVYDDGEIVFSIRVAIITRIVCGTQWIPEILNQHLKLLPKARLAQEPLILLGEENSKRMIIESEIFKTISRGELALALQPIIDIHTKKVVFYEVLARYVSENDTFPAQVFMPAVETLGLFREMDRQILYKALAVLKESPEIEKLSINISLEYLFRELESDLLRWTKELEILHEAVILEITERKSPFSPLALSSKLHFLKSNGFNLGLDDFGVEISNLFLLREISWDLVKVDGRFIKGLVTNKFDQEVVRFLSGCTKLLKFKLVAEQVEDAHVFNELFRFGIHYAQGFFCGKPEIIPETRFLKPPRREEG
ncbi:EAL domain-containing protein [Thermosulfurimonas dismutans]|uniref:Putative cyclic di-GMP phosphodiesterase, EAL domain protein n=1 Tax=Thermosulfurimonas dismutans TaxID=999894 RepID=A0A179D6T1_9BACT|nr:GGDEF domain-containing protein [Thermosulfurimonas dismutans]OAQ21795.1 putative cyclic di-GMP phosphodiesterase, EAL domain protein [Thermosulfurimonas dismutans]